MKVAPTGRTWRRSPHRGIGAHDEQIDRRCVDDEQIWHRHSGRGRESLGQVDESGRVRTLGGGGAEVAQDRSVESRVEGAGPNHHRHCGDDESDDEPDDSDEDGEDRGDDEAGEGQWKQSGESVPGGARRRLLEGGSHGCLRSGNTMGRDYRRRATRSKIPSYRSAR